MSKFLNCYGFRHFCLSNFPFLEKDFDALTDYELISKIFEHFEKEIKAVDEKYAGFGQTVETLESEFNELKTSITATLNEFETSINQNVEQRLTQNYNEIIQLLANYQLQFNNQLLLLKNELEEEIRDIELGNVIAYNPTNGEYENVSKVIMDVYDTLRANGITCTEFDGLEMTTTEFDALEITAYNFDVNGKTLLT